MNIKKAVIESVKEKLRKEQESIRHKIYMNKYGMKKLVDEQTKNKRELVLLEGLIKNLDV